MSAVRSRFRTAAAPPRGAAILAGGLLLLTACGKPSAFGEANSLIVVHSDDELWNQVSDQTFETLEPRLFTVRPEKKFFVEPVNSQREEWEELRTFRQVLVFGTPDDRWLEQVADEADDEDPLRPGNIFQAQNIWARDQLVTGVVLDPDRPAESWREALPDLIELVDRQYRQFVSRRMFVSGPDTALADSLGRRFGFSLLVPEVYDLSVRGEEDGDSLVVLRNDNPDPSQLIRSVLVSWRADVEELTPEVAYEWRSDVDDTHYVVPQEIETENGEMRRLTIDGRPALEATGNWRDEGGAVPAGGPFIARLVQCPERTYFLDGWVYAPARSKYQYVLQVREILESFSCRDTGG